MSTRAKANHPVSSIDRIVIFQEKAIRRVWHNEQWWFAVADVVETLVDSADVRQYIKKMRSRDPMLDGNWGTICTPFRYWRQMAKYARPIAPIPNAHGFADNSTAAKEGGTVAGNARKELEAKTGTPVISRQNYLNPREATSAAIAVTAFVETQTEAEMPAQEDKLKTHKRVEKKPAAAIADLQGKKKSRDKNK